MSSELQPTSDAGGTIVDATRGPWLGVGLLMVAVAAIGWYALARSPAPTPPEPSGSAAPHTANFTQVEGTVKVKGGGQVQWGDATLDGELRESDLVRTGVRSTADIHFLDETQVNVRPESLITIQPPGGAADAAAQRRAAWHVSSGEVNFQRQVEDGSTEVSTPTIRSTISERASANIRVDPSGDSDIRLFAGRGEVETTAGDRVELAENEGLRVDAEGNAGTKVTLPGPPGLASPADGAELYEAAPPRDPLVVRWTSAPGGAEYHVTVAEEPSFANPLVDERVASLQIELPRLPRGRYHWHVATIGAEGGEGAFSTARRFDVVAPPAGPPLEVTRLEVRGNIAQIQGRTTPGSRVTVDGNEVPVQADGSFDEFVTLLGQGDAVVVRALAPDGGVSQERRPLRGR